MNPPQDPLPFPSYFSPHSKYWNCTKSDKQGSPITPQFKQTGNLTVMRGESQAFNNYNIKIIKKAYKEQCSIPKGHGLTARRGRNYTQNKNQNRTTHTGNEFSYTIEQAVKPQPTLWKTTVSPFFFFYYNIFFLFIKKDKIKTQIKLYINANVQHWKGRAITPLRQNLTGKKLMASPLCFAFVLLDPSLAGVAHPARRCWNLLQDKGWHSGHLQLVPLLLPPLLSCAVPLSGFIFFFFLILFFFL